MKEYDASVFDGMTLGDPEGYYGDDERYDFEYGGPSISYRKVVETFGYDVILQETLGSWQGDIVFILKDGNKAGFLIIGYGSCAGCDVLEGMRRMDELKSFALGTYSRIKWFDSLTDLQLWLIKSVIGDDIEPGPYYYYDTEMKDWAQGFTQHLQEKE